MNTIMDVLVEYVLFSGKTSKIATHEKKYFQRQVSKFYRDSLTIRPWEKLIIMDKQ